MKSFHDLTPFGSFLLGEEPTIEDFILLIGTVVAFIAFILWCCFPVQSKESIAHQEFACSSIQHSNSKSPSANMNCSSGNNASMYGCKIDQFNGQFSYHCCANNDNNNCK